MTGGRIRRVREYLEEDTFMMTYGDGVADINIKELLEYHRLHGKMATLTAAQPGGRFGILDIENDGTITNFREKKKEDGGRQAEKILLTWMIEDAGIFEKVKEYISPQDFVNPLFKDVADKLYAQYESGSLNPAAIISTYDAEETHSEVAAMFSMELDNRLNHNEREKALNDTVLKVKNNSIQYQIDQAADPAQIQQLYTMKNKLSAIHITL